MPDETLFKGVMETAAAPILVVTRSFTVHDLNPEVEALWGMSAQDIKGRPLFGEWSLGGFDGITPDDLDKVINGTPLKAIEGRINIETAVSVSFCGMWARRGWSISLSPAPI